ncbi:acyl-CoA/acyl-ACP dehydrogenase [Nonomuraea sp. NN258]|uniref:acyl-CoA/acyl-ACP dehydrogenase n=1 Tax=Nonomuraea antri TaxID=2730852 RepID=UPI001568CA59|nr:acyl-CoA/acyl-ACP dehydrogenase [Nonomuraea antri]NRQ33096.1 acyl-CoA/acyl-ACP dehydrogenase [Nonomuraea antri]
MVLEAMSVVAANAGESHDPEVMTRSLRAMVGAGAFGAWLPREARPPGAVEIDGFVTIERYAECDLAAAFVLSQHPMFVETALRSGSDALLADVAPLVRGAGISAVGFSDMRRGRSPEVLARAGEIVLTGSVSRVSGTPWASWLLVGAIDRSRGADEVIFAFIELDDAARGRISYGPREDAAGLTASDTRTVTLDGVRVPLSHVTGRRPLLEWLADDHRRIVNVKPFHYGYGRRLLSLIEGFGDAGTARRLRLRLDRNRAEALELQAASGPRRSRERLVLRLRGYAVLREIAGAYARAHVAAEGVPSPDLVTRTVRILEFPATNRYIQRQAELFFADPGQPAAEMPAFNPAEMLAALT